MVGRRTAAVAIRSGSAQAPLITTVDLSTGLIAYPECGVVAREPYPPNACMYFFQCRECGSITRPQPGDGRVFRSFGRPRECPCFLSEAPASKLTH